MKLFIINLFIISFFSVIAQDVNTNWIITQSNNKFEISAKKLNCVDASKGISKEYLFLKISNKTNKTITLDYKIEKWYDGVCSNCTANAENSPISISLSAKETTSGTCEDYRNRDLAVFSRMTGNAKARELSSFKILPLSLNGEKL